jgi:hypothetical protein
MIFARFSRNLPTLITLRRDFHIVVILPDAGEWSEVSVSREKFQKCYQILQKRKKKIKMFFYGF